MNLADGQISRIPGGRQNEIKRLLTVELAPTHLEIIDESIKHARGHEHLWPETPGVSAESHIKVIVVSASFAGLSKVKRQQLVFKVLQPLFDDGLHSLMLTTATPDEWVAGGVNAVDSPVCAHRADNTADKTTDKA